jgi:thiol-disulfide isomerase/thioredoxin
MKKKTLFSFLAIALFTTLSFAQNRALPNKDVKTLDGSNFNITNLENDGNPIVISFWATWCKP